MQFSEILGLDHIKRHLITGVDAKRIPHAQLFAGKGALPIALAYAQYILCENISNDNGSTKKSCQLMTQKLGHPDLHFAFPVATNDKIKSVPVSSLFMEEWRSFVLSNPYADVFDWFQFLGVENKQGILGVQEANDIVKKLSLKSFEGGFKIMIVWMADKMNTECANKLLKLLEEPPQKTVFILIAEEQEKLLQTIVSRCQILQIPLLADEVIAEALVKRENCSYDTAKEIASQAAGVYNTALQLYKSQNEDNVFETWIIQWVRSAFKAKTHPGVIKELIEWSENIAQTGRENQKQFLAYCVLFFRQALLLNYSASDLVYIKIKEPNFVLQKFAPFVHGNNIEEIIETLEEASYHIERNGNGKMIFTDTSIKLTRLLHKK